jgi:Ni,Fe-hydrogenase III large subunit
MTWREIKPLELIRFDEERWFSVDEWLAATRELLASGARPVALFRQETNDYQRVWTIFAGRPTGQLCITNTVFFLKDRLAYPSLSADFPCMNYFECELYERTGIKPDGHPWLRPVRSLNRWRENGVPYAFYRVEGEEIHEVGVGPVHAGVIEPGHFRFQCHGEEILHLEIQLGYQHRGIIELLPERKPSQQLVLVESIAGDSVIAHTTAFCSGLEALAGASVSLREQAVRGVAAELERVAMHLSTLSGIATDIGFAMPAGAFGALRTAVINLSAEICGSRFGRGWIIPGGVRFDLDPGLIEKARRVLDEMMTKFSDIEALLFNSPSALARLEETGAVTEEQARAAGLVGLAARASGIPCDVRADFPYGIYRYSSVVSPTLASGDVYARAKLRALEIRNSVQFLAEQIENLPARKARSPLKELAKNAFVITLTEGHRGEVAHVLLTDANGRVSNVTIKDPSFQNWHGLSLAARENGISDFPLCNKSFDLSYAGHDL